MRSRWGRGCAALFLGLIALPAISAGQTPDTLLGTPALIDTERPVLQYDLSGPRLGATFSHKRDPSTQFGWHFEHQASPGTRGPWFIVETVLLVGGVETQSFIPTGTLIFGFRLPSGYEFGVGPSAALGGPSFLRSSVVLAAGRSFRIDGIRIPVNIAVATDKHGERYSIVTGWAIRDPFRPRR